MNKKVSQNGSALVMVLLISVVFTIIISAFLVTISVQQKQIQYNRKYDKAIWIAEVGVNRFISGLNNQNDKVNWGMSMATPVPINSDGYWLYQYHNVKDENNKIIGKYKVELISSDIIDMSIKSEGIAYSSDSSDKGISRKIGVSLRKFTLGNFAIASNHQIGGAHINGGTAVHGGILTSGKFNLDAASCGVYNDYASLDTNFSGYTIPSTPPNTEIYVFKDKVSSPTPSPNGVIDINNSDLGTSSNPLVAVHTENDSTTDDTDGVHGDGIIGNGAGSGRVNTSSRDHNMPDIDFPVVAPGQPYYENRKAAAIATGSNYTGNVTINASTNNFSIGTAFSYTKNNPNKNIALNGTVFIDGNLTISDGVTYSGKGVILVNGNVNVTGGLQPKTPDKFPQDDAIAIICTGNQQLGENSGNSTLYAGYFFGNNTISIQKAKIYGSIIGGTVNLPTTGTRPDIYIRPDLVSKLGVPLPDFSNSFARRISWWEIPG